MLVWKGQSISSSRKQGRATNRCLSWEVNCQSTFKNQQARCCWVFWRWRATERSLLHRQFTWTSLCKDLEKTFWLQVTGFLNLKGEKKVVKGNLKMFSKLLGLEREGKYQQVSNLREPQLREPEHKIKQSFPFFSTQIYAWVRASLPGSSAQPENLGLWDKRKNFVRWGLTIHVVSAVPLDLCWISGE